MILCGDLTSVVGTMRFTRDDELVRVKGEGECALRQRYPRGVLFDE